MVSQDVRTGNHEDTKRKPPDLPFGGSGGSIGCTRERLALVAAAATLGLAALGAVFFLNTHEAKAAAMLANNARPLDALREASEKLFEALRITEFNTHALNHHPSINT